TLETAQVWNAPFIHYSRKTRSHHSREAVERHQQPLPLHTKSASGAGLKESLIACEAGRWISPMTCVHGTGTPDSARRSWHDSSTTMTTGQKTPRNTVDENQT